MKTRILSLTLLLVAAALPAAGQMQTEPGTEPVSGTCNRSLFADVVALDQPYFWNRLGAVQPHGMVYALKRDVVSEDGWSRPGAGNARLRDEKRPRPIVLRMNVGDCLTVHFTNWLHPVAADNEQVRTRDASVHVTGMQLVDSIDDDGSWVGVNPGAAGSLTPPGQTRNYRFYAEREGPYVLLNGGALTGGEGDNGTISAGLFGAVNVEAKNSVWYRSQVTQADLKSTISSFKSIPRTDPLTGVTWTEQYPVINYSKNHPATHPSRPGLPVLKILAATFTSPYEIIYSDLTAIVQPPAGAYPPPGVPNNPVVYPNRNEPFREFTIVFHDEPGAVQAFPQFYDQHDNEGTEPEDGLAFTLASVQDAFAINYGTGGVGAEILANRLLVGPMHDCVTCLYEEFFLSSWAVGDPAMVVDVPANAPCDMSAVHDDDPPGGAPIEGEPGYCAPQQGPKATVARFPDDPSNVYHSYLNDHVKFRNLHPGSDDHHIFHLHAHQWLHTPDEDNSSYKDSQAIGQGTAFTYEIAFEGSGNRNKTPGDSIFHCHFYPHFAMGMWSLWRVHDVLELGTATDPETGRPKPGARALPDGEIAAGTPIPGLVPLPGEAMPPPPSVAVSIVGGQVQIASIGGLVYGNPGYPFWVPGIAGQRVPSPPLDVFVDPLSGQVHDGGLPRHVVVDGAYVEKHSRLDFSKDVFEAVAFELDEKGEPWERAAMRWHADQIDGAVDGAMSVFKPNGLPGVHRINGSPGVPGAPYADPCGQFVIDPDYPPFGRQYRAANIQMDVVFNDAGWHFPQQRFLSLWGDVDGYFNQGKDPEPLFIRANSGDCVEYLHTNLVPKYYELDDFQVRTPTDVLGQHIHLVKFDVTSSDGSGNGFNYEDGTLSPQEVRGLIGAINARGGIIEHDGDQRTLAAKHHPYFQNVAGADSLGAQTTVQRWYVDPILNNLDENRSLRTVFTHDHFGPSTHQQVGLYAGLLTYKGRSPATQWLDAGSGAPLGGRFDGGPTSWQAVIRGPQDEFREFALEFGDFQLAYWPNNDGFPDPKNAINPPGRVKLWEQIDTKPWIYEKPFFAEICPSGGAPPCPEAISADDPGTAVVNYKSEPIALRVTNNPQSNPTLAPAPRGDLSYAFSSTVHGDPVTPLLKVYEEDPVQMRILVGAHEEEHNFSIHGTRWLFEPAAANSGYKSSQMMGISEYYDFVIPNLYGTPHPDLGFVDFLYKAGSSNDDLWHGIWGLIRVYQGSEPGVFPISTGRTRGNEVNVTQEPDAPRPTMPTLTAGTEGATEGIGGSQPAISETPYPINHASVCPADSLPPRTYTVAAVAASQALPGGRLTYNPRPTGLDKCTLVNVPHPGHDGYSCTSSGLSGPLVDPDAILFVRYEDLNADGTLKATAPIEPLILRARAGECIMVKLVNLLPNNGPFAADRNGYSLLPNILDKFNQNQVPPSARVGLHPTLLSYDVLLSDGNNVGFNFEQTVAPGQSRRLVWYAGISEVDAMGQVVGTPVEFGSVPLYSSDPIKHSNKAAVGALIIEPAGSSWVEARRTRAVAVVDPDPASEGEEFREFVLVFQDDVNMFYANEASPNELPLKPVRPLTINEDPTETGQDAYNYKTEPVWFRQGFLPETKLEVTRLFDLADSFSNGLIGGDPVTPLFRAVAGDKVRFRLVHPAGDTQQHTWGLHGHAFQEQPWQAGSTVIGANPPSEVKGVQYGLGPTTPFDVLPLNGAGGAFQVDGDFMYRDHVQWYLANGMWGVFRVFPNLTVLEVEEPPQWEPVPAPSPTPVEGAAVASGFDATQPVGGSSGE